MNNHIPVSMDATVWVNRLFRELDDMRAEVERLRAEIPVAASLKIKAECAEIERNEARAVVWRQAKEITDLRAEVKRMREALIEWDALIKHQFSGSREAMSDMQYAALNTKQILDELYAREALNKESQP